LNKNKVYCLLFIVLSLLKQNFSFLFQGLSAPSFFKN